MSAPVKSDSTTFPVKILGQPAVHNHTYTGWSSNNQDSYLRSTEHYSLRKVGTGGEEAKYYIMQSYDTYKDGVMKTATVFLWSVNEENVESFTKKDIIHPLPDGRQLCKIKCPIAMEQLIECPHKELIVSAFTTNDIARLSSFGSGSNSEYIEFHFVKAKCKFVIHHTRRFTPEERHNFAMTNSRLTSDTLADILDDVPNNKRFISRIPEGLSKEEAKQYEQSARAAMIERIKALSPDAYCALEDRWLQKSLDLKTSEVSPRVMKEKLGAQAPMMGHVVDEWNSTAPLIFLLVTTHFYYKNPDELHLANPAGQTAWIAEITPKDQRYGVSPPDKEDLTWVSKTFEGIEWLIDATKKHRETQEAFVGQLKLLTNCPDNEARDKSAAAFFLLSSGINMYKHGILGLVKFIALQYFRGEIIISNTLATMIHDHVMEFGLDWRLHRATVVRCEGKVSEEYDPFWLYQSIGLRGASSEPGSPSY